MPEAYIPKPGERYLAVDYARCPDCPDCVPVRVCPVSALSRRAGETVLVDHRACLACGSCLKPCAPGALSLQRG